jgi:hypothetical protein
MTAADMSRQHTPMAGFIGLGVRGARMTRTGAGRARDEI